MFAWSDFLTLAERLATSGDEAELRSAISRAYYAAFHAARDVCRDTRIPIPSEVLRGSYRDKSDHSRLISALKEDPNHRLKHAGKLIASMRRVRNDADYRLSFGGDVGKAAQKAILDAHSVIDDLDNFFRGA